MPKPASVSFDITSSLDWKYQSDEMIPPRRDTNENDHVDNRRQTHGKRADEKRLCRVPDHCEPYFGIDGVAE